MNQPTTDRDASSSHRPLSPRPSAVRMRRLRERRRDAAGRRDAGTTRVFFDISPGGVALLVELGWLTAADQRSEPALQRAFDRFVNAAAAAGVTPPQDAAPDPPLAPSVSAPKSPRPEWLAKMFREWEERIRAGLPPVAGAPSAEPPATTTREMRP